MQIQMLDTIPRHLLAPARKMNLNAMEQDFTYVIAQNKPSTQCECYPKTVKLFEEGLISKREYNIISELNKENFMPYFMGIL